MKKRWMHFGVVAILYFVIYLVCKEFFYIGKPYHMYTPDWTARNILLYCGIISAGVAVFGWIIFPYITFGGYVLGVILGELFGGFQSNVPPEYKHYGWCICICLYVVAALLGMMIEMKRRRLQKIEE